MNNIIEKIEYPSEEEMIAFMGSAAAGVKPSEASLRALLEKLPAMAPPKHIPSPYAPQKSPFVKYWMKAAVTMLAIVILVGSGTLYVHKNSAPLPVENISGDITQATRFVATTTSPNDMSRTTSGNQIAMVSPMMATAPTAMMAAGDSDESLAQDAQSIDVAMASLDADNASADQSMQDSSQG